MKQFLRIRQLGFLVYWKTGNIKICKVRFNFIRYFLLRPAFTIVATLVGLQPVICQAVDPQNEYFFHINDYPKDGSMPSWGDRTWAPNGIAHDKANWYFGSVNRWGAELGYKTRSTDWTIWRWPIKEGIDQDLDNNHKGVKTFQLSSNNTAGSIFAQYGHLGDIDHCLYEGVDYLLLPLTGGGKPIIAFFRADNLTFVNYSFLPGLDKINSSIGWCAFNIADGNIYTSDDNAAYIMRYKIDWKIVNNTHHDALNLNGTYKLEPTIYNMQGGEFTPDGKLLYVSSGVVPDTYPTDGISVLETTGWKRIHHSTNKERNQNSCFDFNFDNSSYLGREPEGLTIWDIDGKGAPYNSQSNLTGQLHVLLDNHNWPGSPSVAVMHYKYETISFPDDIIVKATTSNGEPATNATITTFLSPTSSYGPCAKISNNAPKIFPQGKTSVIFTVIQNNQTITEYTANVTVTGQNNCIVAYYPFNGNANDESGNAFHATVKGATLTADRFGKPNSAYRFNGSSFIEVLNSGNMHLKPGTLTLTAWVKYNNNKNNEIVSKHLYGASSGYLLGVYLDEPGFYLDKGCLTNGLYAGKKYNDDNWHFVVGVFDGISQFLYVDNVLKNKQCADYAMKNNVNLVIGASFAFAGGYAGYFTGSIDEVRVYNCALDTATIGGLYKSGMMAIPRGGSSSGNQTGNNQSTTSGIEIYPNPTNGRITISLQRSAPKTSIMIYNMTGQIILHTTISQTRTEIDLSSVTAGVYFVRIFNDNTQSIQRIIKQ